MAKKTRVKELPPELKQVGLRLRGIRKGLGFSNYEDFANHYDLNRSQYGKYEAGSEDFQISSLIKILDKLGMGLSTFFNEEFDKLDSGTD